MEPATKACALVFLVSRAQTAPKMSDATESSVKMVARALLVFAIAWLVLVAPAVRMTGGVKL
jgi:hypothetical protein